MKDLLLGRRGRLVLLMISMLLLTGCSSDAVVQQKHNIIFIVIDDFGLDQMTSYGYGGALPPKTPNLTAIGKAGLQFRTEEHTYEIQSIMRTSDDVVCWKQIKTKENTTQET